MTIEAHSDAELRAAVLALHRDGRHWTLRGVIDTLRGRGMRFPDYRIEELVRDLRMEGLIPGRVNATSAFRRVMVPPPKARGEPVPWWRLLRREHLRRERSIAEWARKAGAASGAGMSCGG